jgi:DNA-binding transcriptional regulator YdaS (Cro superfamily)
VTTLDVRLKEFGNEQQGERLDAVNKYGSYQAAADALGVSKTAINQSIDILKRNAALRGHAPEHDMNKIVPDGFKIKGVSTYYNAEGKASGQWVKSSADEERRVQIIKDAFEAMAEELPKIAPFVSQMVHNDALCNVYVMTDCHVGMLAWHKESGQDWDLKIAERVLTGCFEQMVQASPIAGTCIVGQLGDWLHFDGMVAATPMSGHPLDADGRFSKIIQVSVRILRRLVDFCLERHEKVVVLMAEGNHDMVSSIWLRIMFKSLYENEPRVEVIDSELPYYVYQHGQTMIGFHHGHLSKNNSLPLLFAAQFAPVWGSTTKRYIHTGHRHHVEEKEHNGVTVIQHPTLAARDAYAARGGWIAERQVSGITYHKDYGQVAKNTVTPEMLT